MKRKLLLVIGITAFAALGYGCLFAEPSETPVASGTEAAVALAKEDLAKRKGIDKEEIVVVKVGSVDWPDTSLGCPEPGMMYAQVITPGYKILLSYAGETYEYHSDKGDRVVYCGDN